MKTNTENNSFRHFFQRFLSPFSVRSGGFTLMEILVAVSILATVSVVAYVSYAGHIKSVNNATRIQTIDTLHLSLSDYFQMKKTLPEPKSNAIFYDERGTYMHSSSGSYGVSGHASHDFLPTGYVNFRAVDPESNQFYGYGKLTDNSFFDIAAALYDETTGGYKTYLRGTYPKQRLASLIRSYSSSNFVSQNSTEELPYNPYERKVNAYVSSYSGTVEATDSKWIPLSLTGELNSGDTVKVATGSTALLHLSDGSELSLGSPTTETILSLDTLEYSDDNNLVSKVKLLLSLGEVWVEAPRLRTDSDSASDFSIQTDSAVAAIRGTVFGVSRNSIGVTAISLVSGKLEVDKIIADGTTAPFTGMEGFAPTATGGFLIENTQSYMIVPEWGTPIKLDGIVAQESTIGASDISVNSEVAIDTEDKIHHPPFSFGYRPKADRISFTPVSGSNNGILSVTFQNPGADSYELSFGTGEVDDSIVSNNRNPNRTLTGTLDPTQVATTLTGTFPYINEKRITRNYTLRICSQGKCSAPDIKGLGGASFDFENFRVWGEKKDSVPATPVPCQFNQILDVCEANLVAYAPYDAMDNLILYGTGGTLDNGNNTDKILNNGTSLNTSIGNVQSYDTDSSFVQMNNGTKGIFIDNVGSGEYLKYTLPPNFLTGSFSIEMSVRGGALKRNSCLWISSPCYNRYHLFEFENKKIYLSSYSWTLVLWDRVSWFKDYLKIDNFSNLQDNSFYKVIASFNWNNWSLKIIWNWVDINWISITGNNTYQVNLTNPENITIASRKNSSIYDSQWNDIIDSVKIFKN